MTDGTVVLAIDPGTNQSGYVSYDSSTKQVLESGFIDNQELLEMIHNKSLIPTKCAIEMIQSFGMPIGAETINTILFIGRLVEAWASEHDGMEPTLLYRKDIKVYLCNSMKAKDQNIRQALIDKLGEPGTKNNKGATYGISGHLWSALAVAVTYAETINKLAHLTDSQYKLGVMWGLIRDDTTGHAVHNNSSIDIDTNTSATETEVNEPEPCRSLVRVTHPAVAINKPIEET